MKLEDPDSRLEDNEKTLIINLGHLSVLFKFIFWRGPGKMARSKPGFTDEILTPIRAPHPGLVRDDILIPIRAPRPVLVFNKILTTIRAPSQGQDFNPNKGSSSRSRPDQF